MPNLNDWIKPEWIIPIVGVLVALVIFYLLRNIGKVEPEMPLEVKTETRNRGERRANPRKRTTPVVVDLLDPEGVRPRLTAVVTDRSTGGLALHSQDEIPPESAWTIFPRTQRGTVKVSLPIEVIRCTRVENGFTVNCRFLRTVNYNELLNFE